MPTWAGVLVVAGLYYGAARLGLALGFEKSNASPVWPPSGLALAAVLLLGGRVWPGILVGAFAANFAVFAGNLTASLGTLAGVSGVIAVGNTLEAVAGLWLFRRWNGAGNSLEDGAAVMRFVGVAAVMCLVSAGVGSVSLLAGGIVSAEVWGTVALTWWTGDLAGVLILTPALLGLGGGLAPSKGARRRESFGLMLVLVVVAAIPFGNWLPRGLGQALMFLLFPALLWPVFRLSQRAAATAVVCVSFLATWQTVNGLGPFARESLNESLLLLQGFVCVIAITIHALAASLAERRRVVVELAAALAERRRVVVALTESEGRLRQVTETLPQLVWTCLPDGRCDYLSPQWVAYSGRSESEQLGYGWAEQLHPEDRARITESWGQAAAAGREFDVEFRIRRHDGVYRWFKTRAVPLRDSAGAILKWFGTNTDIEELRQAEARLRELNDSLEQRVAERTGELETLYRTSPVGLAQLDRELRFVRINETLARFHGHTVATELGLTLREAVPHLADKVEPMLREVFATGTARTAREVPLALTGMTGGVRWFQPSYHPQFDAAGRVVAVNAVVVDVTERKRLAQLLGWEKQAFERIASSASLAEVLNDLVLGLEGLAEGAVGSVLLLDGVHLRHGAAPSLPEAYNRAIDGVVIGPEVGSCGTAAFTNQQIIVTDIATDPLWANHRELALAHGLRACWSTPIASSAGKVLGTFGIYYREPRSPKPVELEVINRAQHLVGLAIERKQGESELELMRIGVERAGDSIFWISREGQILYVNDAACTGRGYSRAELLGMKIFDLDPDYQPGIWGPHFDNLKRQGTITLETRHRAKDGRVFPVEVNANYVFIHGQEFNFASLRDITVRKRIEQKQFQLSADLQRSNQELEQFAYVASHDLQEPLRAVAGCVQILRQRYAGKLDARADELIRHSVEGAERMQGLIADLLMFSSVGTQGGKLVPMESSAALAAALANLRIALTESGATVTHDPLPPVVGDLTQLTQLFQNLVGNALKYRAPARPPVIHLSATREGEGEPWRFGVRDNGLGIEPQYFERIFVIFQRLHTRAEYPGTGIGLALCKKIVERHGGRLWLESQPGEGSTFFFTLPPQT